MLITVLCRVFDDFAFQRYGLEGFKKTFIKRTKSINQIVMDLVERPGTSEEHVVFTTNKDQAKEKQIPFLKSTCARVA